MIVTWSSELYTGTQPQQRLGSIRARRLCLSGGADADGDGLDDDCDPCFNDGGRDFLPRAKLKLSKINTNPFPENDRLKLVGEFELPGGTTFAVIDPTVTPVNVVIEAGSGDGRVEEWLPATVFAGSGTAGWSPNSKGTRWSYKDSSSLKRNGLRRVLLKDRSSKGPGRVQVKVVGSGGTYPINTGDDPVRAIVAVGDGAIGRCGEATFAPTDCSFNSKGGRAALQQLGQRHVVST